MQTQRAHAIDHVADEDKFDIDQFPIPVSKDAMARPSPGEIIRSDSQAARSLEISSRSTKLIGRGERLPTTGWIQPKRQV